MDGQLGTGLEIICPHYQHGPAGIFLRRKMVLGGGNVRISTVQFLIKNELLDRDQMGGTLKKNVDGHVDRYTC